jgi:hypothetical protein
MPRPREKRIPLTIGVSKVLKAELEAEAWESERTLSDYVRGLLERRGKWRRSVGTSGGYDLQAESPSSEREHE